jgi:hypothetical protein
VLFVGGIVSRLFASALTQYLRVASSAISAYPYTICGWSKLPALGVADHSVVSISDGSGLNQVLIRLIDITATTGTVRYRVANAGVESTIDATTTFDENSWLHFAVRALSATDRSVWLNGGGRTDSAVSSALPTLTESRLGATGEATVPLNGLLENVAVWSAGLSEDEIIALAQRMPVKKIQPQNITAHWQLNDNGTLAMDSGPNKYHMTNINGNIWYPEISPIYVQKMVGMKYFRDLVQATAKFRNRTTIFKPANMRYFI